jgi:hypothetical protein
MTQSDVPRWTVPLWEQAKEAVEAGDSEVAVELIDRAVAQWRSLQDYSINWITSLLSFVGQRLGEDGVEDALRVFGEEFVRARRSAGSRSWDSLPASVRAKAIAQAMVANFGQCDVREDEDKIVLSFRCGSGGRMIDEGRYETEGGPYLVLREAAGRTFGRDQLPVYCAHCAVNNEIQAVEWGGAPTTVEFPSEGPGGRCVHHIYKDPAVIPADAYRRIGKSRP